MKKKGWAQFPGATHMLVKAVVCGCMAVALLGAAEVTTQHNDLSRTGANLQETVLNTSNVKVSTFGKLFSRTVDGQIYAQPLYLPGVAIPFQGTHNIVYVCTEHNSVYAFDADQPGLSNPLWSVNLGPSLPATVINSNKDLVPEIGITSTPVIDTSSSTIYVVAETYENNHAIFRLHALDLATGAEHPNSPAVIQGSVAGTGLASVNGVLAFDPLMQWQRPGLLLLNGNIYIGFGSHQDRQPYHGWIFAYSASTLQRVALLCLSPNADSAGVWHAGMGLTADANGNIYVQTGHGEMSADTGGQDYGDSTVKISTASGLTVVDYFTPANEAALSAGDIDFGSSAPVLIPGTSLAITGGKDGKLFLLSTNNLGQFHATDQVVQSWQATFSLLSTGAGGFFGGPVYYNSMLYVWGRRDKLKVFAFDGTQFNTTPVFQSTFTIPDGYSNEPALSLSADGTTPGTGILWASYSAAGPADGNPYPGILRAFDAADVTKELWNSNQNAPRDNSGSWAKWCAPTIANGKVYLGTFDKVLNVYGVFPVTTGGTLTGSGNSNTGAVDLTGEGAADWVHWGETTLIRKTGVAAQISTYSPIGTTTVGVYGNDPRSLNWSDGTPTASGTNNKRGVFISGLQSGYYITLPADITTRTLTLHVGGWNSGAALNVHLSDGSAPDFVDTVAPVSGQYDRNYTLTYSAASAGQVLMVTWTMVSGAGNVTLSGAALAGEGLNSGSVVATGGTPQSTTVTASFPTLLQATVRDSSNQPVSGITVTFTAPSGGPSGRFSGSATASAVTDSNGVAIAPVFTANSQAGAYSVTATVPGNFSIGGFNLTNNPGPAAAITAAGGTPQSATVNTAFGTMLLATVKDAGNNPISGATVTFTAPATGASGTFSGIATANAVTASNGVATAPLFTANNQSGTYAVAANTSGVSTPANFSLTNTPVPTGGVLSGSVAIPTGQVQLTTEGTSDWAHWGLTAATTFNHKAGVTQQISNFSLAAGGTPARYANNPIGFTWTDGKPTVSATNSTTGLYVPGEDNGFQLTAPADTTTRTLRVYVGVWCAQAELTAQLSDGSAVDYSDDSLINNGGATTLRVYTFMYHAASAGQTLTITLTQQNPTVAGTIGNVTLQAATLAGGGLAPDYSASATPSSQAVVAGASAGYTVSVTALNGFADVVGFGVSGLPAGVTAAFNPTTVTGGGSSTMMVTTTSGAAAGSYPVTVTATSGGTSHTSNVTLVVTDFSVSATPASQAVVAAGSAGYTVSVTALSGFAGIVGFSVSGLPAGVTAAFNPTTVTGSGSSTMTLTTTNAVAAGSYPVTVTATSGGTEHTSNVTLVVTDFSVSATPPSQSVIAGGSAGYTVSLTAPSGFAGIVGFSASGLPAGVTAAFNPTTVTGSGSSTMTLTTTNAVAAGSYPVTVTATSGGTGHTSNVTLVVTDFSISATPPSQSVIAGGSAAYTVSVTALNGFAGSVGFSVSGLPAGVTAAFNPTTVTGSGSSTMTLTTTGGTAAAGYPLTVTATSGSRNRTANVNLTVTGPVVGGSLIGSIGTPLGLVQLTNEGTLDWAHWGLTAATDLNHKAGVTQQIGNFTLAAGGTPIRYANNPTGYTWTDGTPAPSAANSTTGVYITGQNNGFRLTAPADTTARTLRVYVGAWRAQARMIAQLSDGSALDYSDGTLTNNAGGTTVAVYTFTYAAATGGQTLSIKFTQENPTVAGTVGNVTLQAATLVSGVLTPDYTVSATPPNQSTAAGGSASYTVSVNALNGFTGSVGFTVSGLPTGITADVNPTTVTGSGSSTMTLTTTGGAAVGNYPLTITATSGSLSHTANVSLGVTALGGGSLTGSIGTPLGLVQLTTEGTSDWAHWGLTAATDFNHKAGATQQIGNFTLPAGGTPSRYINNPVGFTWNDGTATGSATNTTTGVYISGQNKGFRLTVPADTTARTLRVYVGAWRTQGRMVAHLSDGSAADYVDTSLNNSAGATSMGVYTFTYQASATGQTLTVTFTQTTGTQGNVTIEAATLQ